ncbi:MAG: biopolymer transporter ExbD [Chthoniobacterales bacterium]|nr:biopolymer transporter ExbD [Chthoniobacterales bacterium]
MTSFRRYSTRHGYQRLAELNVTPLIDLAFTLLIIFMITTPLIESSVEIITPTSRAARSAPPPEAVRVVEVDQSGILRLDGEVVSAEVLTNELSRLRQQESETAVAIRADRNLSIQVLVSLMDVIKDAGVTKIGLLARQEGGKEGTEYRGDGR